MQSYNKEDKTSSSGRGEVLGAGGRGRQRGAAVFIQEPLFKMILIGTIFQI